MTEFFNNLTPREKEIINFFIEQIRQNGEYVYTVRQLVDSLKIHHKTLAKTLEKAKKSGYFEIEDLGLREGYKIKCCGQDIVAQKVFFEPGHQEEMKIQEPLEQPNREIVNIEMLIGRNTEIQMVLSEIKKRKDVLLIGGVGTGKTAILKEVIQILDSQNQRVVYADYAKSFKQFLVNLVYQIHTKYKDIELYEINDKQQETKGKEWKDIKRKVTKLTTNDLSGLVLRATKGKDYILVCDALEMITPTAKSIFESLRENCCLVGATHTIKDNPHLKKLWWRFKQIEIKNLKKEQANELIDYLYIQNNVNAYDKEAFKKKVLRASQGNCSAIYDMIFIHLKKNI